MIVEVEMMVVVGFALIGLFWDLIEVRLGHVSNSQ